MPLGGSLGIHDLRRECVNEEEQSMVIASQMMRERHLSGDIFESKCLGFGWSDHCAGS